MNKQLLVEYIAPTEAKLSLTEGKTKDGRLILNGKLQHANEKNGNGRIYPREILEREINKYINEQINSRTSTGELDHPECFIEGYKILTKEKGWVDFKDILGEEHVATINPENNNFEYQKIEKVINQHYEGEIINIESKSFQASVTPNHKFLVKKSNKIDNKFKYAWELTSSDLIPKKSTYNIDKKEKITIENKYGKIEISTSLFATFMGWWLSEGWIQRNKNSRGKISRGICLSQTKTCNIEELDNIYKSLSEVLNKKWSKHIRKNNEVEYYILENVLYEYLTQFGISNEKYVPKEIKQLDKENIQLFLDSYLKGDGNKQKNQEVYYTTSKQMSLDISELINLTGYMCSISEKELFYEKYLIENKWIKDFEYYIKKDKFVNKVIDNRKKHYTGKTLYSIRRKYSEFYHLSECSVVKSNYKGNIYCVSVPNSTILVMSPNCSTFWSGNSDIINLKNVSHIINNIVWKGDEVWGTIELLNTPSGKIAQEIVLAGIPLGISSRAMGSVKTLGETVEVQDDLSLLCWDLVSTPSTPKAYMNLSEGLNNNQFHKYSIVNSIITDILCQKG